MGNNTLQVFAYIYIVYMREYLQLETQAVCYTSVWVCEYPQLRAQAVCCTNVWMCEYLHVGALSLHTVYS